MIAKVKRHVELIANAGIVAVCIVIGVTLIAHRTMNNREGMEGAPVSQKVKMPLGSGWYALGRANAPVTIVEFMDLQCPFCHEFQTTTFVRLKRYYIDTGRVRLIAMDLPLPMHQYALEAAEGEHCAGYHGKFWQFRDSVLDEKAPPTPDVLLRHAKVLGLNLEQFEACVKANKYEQIIRYDQEQAARMGINGTPAFVIGRVSAGIITGVSITGAQSLSALQQEIEMIMDESPDQVPDFPSPRVARRAQKHGS